jgi:hypothetical protein
MESMVSSEGYITPPWYQYFMAADRAWRPRVNVLTTESTAGIVYEGAVTVFASTAGVKHTLEDPRIGGETVLICNVPSTQGGSVTVAAATDVAIGPSGENALTFLTSASTYELVVLRGTSTSQYYIEYQTTNVDVSASS